MSMCLQPGTLYVVMNCIVMEGSDETLEPGDEVELVRAEPATGCLRVRTLDKHHIEGMVPESYLRRKDQLRGGKMESKLRTWLGVLPVLHVCMFNTYMYMYMYRLFP